MRVNNIIRVCKKIGLHCACLDRLKLSFSQTGLIIRFHCNVLNQERSERKAELVQDE